MPRQHLLYCTPSFHPSPRPIFVSSSSNYQVLHSAELDSYFRYYHRRGMSNGATSTDRLQKPCPKRSQPRHPHYHHLCSKSSPTLSYLRTFYRICRSRRYSLYVALRKVSGIYSFTLPAYSATSTFRNVEELTCRPIY